MKTKLSLFTILFAVFTLFLSGCAQPEAAVVEINPLPGAAAVQPPEPTSTPTPKGALSTAANFINWYLNFGADEYGIPLSPFEEGGHRTCDYLTPDYITRINAEVSVAPEQRGTYDPVLSGWGPVDSSRIEVFHSEGNTASVIATLEGMDWNREITIDLVYTGAAWLVDDIRGASIATPQGVTQLFYEWYLDYYRSHGDPLDDGVYKSSPYLSDAYIHWVNGVQTSFDNDGFDPFLMSRAIPTGAAVQDVQVSGDRATVLVNRFLMTPQYNPLVVHLERQGIFWKIVDVTMEDAPATPAEVVESFYEWYREYSGSSGAGETRNALVDGAYQTSPFLTPDFIQKVDEALKNMQGGGFDPFVCAQVVPDQITPDGTRLVEMYGPEFANKASVVVRTEFAGHVFTVDLVRPEQGKDWQIDQIVCGGSPSGRVHAFYTWYQGCLEESPTCRPPDQDYTTSGFVTDAFIERVESLRAGYRAADVSGYNPITMSQTDIPAYSLDVLSETEEMAEIVLTNLAWPEHTLLIELVYEDSSWKIDTIGFFVPNTPAAVTKFFVNAYAIVRSYPQDPGTRYSLYPEKHLTLELQHAIETYLETGMPEGKDPIFLSDNIPQRIEVEDAILNDNRAVVVITCYWADEAEPTTLSADLQLVDGVWRIAAVR
jgi:hypothetical protein